MTEQKLEKVHLLPQTVRYYQTELTRFLEFERYTEAAELLRILIGCESSDSEAQAEWQGLLDWIVTFFPEAREGAAIGTGHDPEEMDLTEEELFEQYMQQRAEQNPDYVRKLLEVFKRRGDWEKQVLALEQLRYLQHPEMEGALKAWLAEEPVPPSLQFKALQVLKHCGVTGKIQLRRSGRTRRIDARDIPTCYEEYPLPYQEIVSRVCAMAGCEGFPLDELAVRTWEEFLAYSFASPTYLEILSAGVEEWDAWAAAYHHTLLMAAQGAADEAELKDRYGVTEELESAWQRARTVFKEFSKTVFPSFH